VENQRFRTSDRQGPACLRVATVRARKVARYHQAVNIRQPRLKTYLQVTAMFGALGIALAIWGLAIRSDGGSGGFFPGDTFRGDYAAGVIMGSLVALAGVASGWLSGRCYGGSWTNKKSVSPAPGEMQAITSQNCHQQSEKRSQAEKAVVALKLHPFLQAATVFGAGGIALAIGGIVAWGDGGKLSVLAGVLAGWLSGLCYRRYSLTRS
jgi:hypothetical protein